MADSFLVQQLAKQESKIWTLCGQCLMGNSVLSWGTDNGVERLTGGKDWPQASACETDKEADRRVRDSVLQKNAFGNVRSRTAKETR